LNRINTDNGCLPDSQGKISGRCMIKCMGDDKLQIKTCDKIENKYPFLRGAKAIVDDFDIRCGLMKNGKIRCIYGDGSGGSRFVVDGLDDAITFDYRGGHGCALQANGAVKCWGENSHGELGNGTINANYGNRTVATRVTGLERE
jgi:Regulator of chromosome condensation (RCC1) repeat